jgi:hypothetical protein
MSSVNFVLVNPPTNTARFLTCMIFNKDALATLRIYGLVNVYLDDYGHSKKYRDCLFFLFHLKDNKDFDEFQFKLADFTSFYDFYDVVTPDNTMRMYVFKVHDVYRRDLFSFKHSRVDELSKSFLNIADPEADFTKLQIDITQEIYRFYHYLETIKEDI